ncbi:MAG: ATP phosphoribosyltransferase regulatory subunit [Pseudomonadota bacterium]
MTPDAAIRAESDALVAGFEALGAQRIEADVLQPADTLLDLYGEDIRARAYVTHDPLRGDQMLRPDFTVPVVQMHMAAAAEPARYTYAGTVFRRQEGAPDRPSEYPQVGYEVFDGRAPEMVEAELYSAVHAALTGLPVTALMGDMGILRAAVASLETTEDRKAALMRHLWRPARFRALLDRFTSLPVTPATPETGPEIGLRSAADVAGRLDRMHADAAAPRLDKGERAALEAILAVDCTADRAPGALKATGARGIEGPVKRLDARLEELSTRGIDVSAIRFLGSYGRTSMEYYDGFVFGFAAPSMPSVATGGRYDALTRVLGQGRAVPAVGGVIRPDLVAGLRAKAGSGA